MQLLSYLAGGLPGLILSGSTLLVFLYGGYQVIHGTLTMGAFVAFLAYSSIPRPTWWKPPTPGRSPTSRAMSASKPLPSASIAAAR